MCVTRQNLCAHTTLQKSKFSAEDSYQYLVVCVVWLSTYIFYILLLNPMICGLFKKRARKEFGTFFLGRPSCMLILVTTFALRAALALLPLLPPGPPLRVS